jgi:hypothetical protein
MTKNKLNLRNVIALAICLAGVTVFAGCDKEPDPIESIAVESISLNKTTLTIAIGETVTLTATTVPANVAVIWTSSNANAVVENGKVTGKAEGTAVITTKAGDKTATCEVTVRGALINGVVWALRNVDAAGTFAATHESTGKYYQWNSKNAWGGSEWNPELPTGAKWTKSNDPSPEGWRVPTVAQMRKLVDDDSKVSSAWTTQNGVKGYKFTDKANGASIFLPAAGYVKPDGQLISEEIGTNGYYYTATVSDAVNKFVYNMYFSEGVVNNADVEEYGYGNWGLNVRSVLE